MDIQFEKLYLSLGGKQSELEKEDGKYTHSKSQMAWEVWQAKASVMPCESCSVNSHEIIINETKSELIDSYDIAKEDEYLLESLVYRGVCIGKAQTSVPEGFVLVSAEQMSQWGHMASYAEQYGCPECFEARGYAHSLACEINEFFATEPQEPAND